MGIGDNTTIDHDLNELVRSLEDRINRLEQAGQIGTWYLDMRERTLRVSPWHVRTLGMPPVLDLDSDEMTEFLTVDHETTRQMMLEAALEGMPITMIRKYHPSSGIGPLWVRQTAEPVFDETGNVTGFNGTTQRIDHEIQAKEERQAFYETLQRVQRDESASYLAGGLAHELSNLLQPALLLCELASIAAADNDAERVADCVDKIGSAIQRSGDVIRATLDLARVDSDELVPIRIDDALEDLQIFLDHQLLARVDVDIASEVTVLSFMATRAGVVQVALNLLKNASQASSPDDRILVRASGQVGSTGTTDAIVVEVVDQGSGFSTEALARAFDPRFTTRFGTSGNGLGLAVVRSMAERWGGTVELSNNPTVGATVTICVPVAGHEA